MLMNVALRMRECLLPSVQPPFGPRAWLLPGPFLPRCDPPFSALRRASQLEEEVRRLREAAAEASAAADMMAALRREAMAAQLAEIEAAEDMNEKLRVECDLLRRSRGLCVRRPEKVSAGYTGRGKAVRRGSGEETSTIALLARLSCTEAPTSFAATHGDSIHPSNARHERRWSALLLCSRCSGGGGQRAFFARCAALGRDLEPRRCGALRSRQRRRHATPPRLAAGRAHHLRHLLPW